MKDRILFCPGRNILAAFITLVFFFGCHSISAESSATGSLLLETQYEAVAQEQDNADETRAENEIEPDEAIPEESNDAALKRENGRTQDDILQAPDVRGVISINKVFWSFVFLLLGFLVIKAVVSFLNLFAERKPRLRGSLRRVTPFVRIVGWSMVIYIIISGIIKPPTETVFAFFASVGVAVGFASQDLLKNIFGGLMILFDKPFQVGDKIESGKYYGEVIEIGLRSTRIVTPDDSVVSVPNSEMMSQSIANSNYGENNCQVVAEIFLPMQTDTRRARQIALETAQVSKYVYLNKPIAVEFFNEINPKGAYIKMRLKAYVLDITQEFPFKSEMTEIVIRELQKEGLLNW